MLALAKKEARTQADVEAETVLAAPYHIQSRRDVVHAAAHILDTVEARFADRARLRPDAVLLACFGEPGLGALREVVDVPVFGLLDSSAEAAAAEGTFSILTPGARWPAQLWELLAVYGLKQRCRSIAVYSDDSLAADQAVWQPALQADCAAVAAHDKPDTIIIGGALGAGRAANVQPPPGVRVLDAFLATLNKAKRAVCP